MRTTSAVFLAAAGASLTSALPQTPTAYATNTTQSSAQSLTCPGPDGNFCVGDTMSTLLSCTNGVPKTPVQCSEQTASQPPLGSSEASCYQSSTIAGDAACTKNCTVYPLSGNSYPVPGDCTPTIAEASSAPAPPAYSSAEAPPAESTPESYEAESSSAPEATSAAPVESMPAFTLPMESMPVESKSAFPFKFPGPMMLNMTMPSMPASSSVEAAPEETSSAPEMIPTELPAPSAPVFTKPSVEVSSSAPAPVLETPTPTPAAPELEMPSAPPAVSSVEAPPAPAPSSSEAPAAPTAATASAVAPSAFSIPPFLSHIIGNFIPHSSSSVAAPAAPISSSSAAIPAAPIPSSSAVPPMAPGISDLGSFVAPPASSIPLPTTDMIATSTIPMAPITHTYASPSAETPGPAYTYTTDSDFSLLPKATLPPYITTVTVGTKTQYHTIFSDCGNGTMIFGSSTIALPTGAAPTEVPAWMATGSLPPVPTLTTIPCSEATGGWNDTAMYTPKKTSALYSYIATLPASATPSAADSMFSQGDGYDHSGGSESRQISVFLLCGFVFGVAAMVL